MSENDAHMNWRVFSASAIGKSHLDGSLPCQDAVQSSIVGDFVIGVVCDGAGTAKHSEIAAKQCADSVVDLLSHELNKSQHETSSGSIESLIRGLSETGSDVITDDLQVKIQEVVGLARNQLVELAHANNFETRDLYCTLVGMIACPKGGIFFHIGDGLGIANHPEDDAIVLSEPENGEYSNETYFLTADDWCDHLRITPFTGSGWTTVALMSDGAMPFVMAKGHKGFYKPFADPVITFLRQQEGVQHANEALYATLASEKTFSITSDDKSLLVALLA